MGECWAVWLHCREANPSFHVGSAMLCQEGEEVPASLLQLVGTSPNGTLFGLALSGPKYPTVCSSMGGRDSGSEQRDSKCETLGG